jgi:hypothetical protein
MNLLLTLFGYSGFVLAAWATCLIWRSRQIEKENRSRRAKQQLESMLSVRVPPGLHAHNPDISEAGKTAYSS